MPDLRYVDRELEASKVMQRMLNHPLAIREANFPMILSAVRAKYGLKSITMGDAMFGEDDMAALAMSGGKQAMARDAQRRNGRIFDESEGIAVIPVYGTLTKSWGLDPWSGITGYDGIEAKVVAAMLDENIRGIWFDIESGGGDVSGLFDLCDLIWSCNAFNGGKPIYAMANEYAYSAAYAIFSCADKGFVPRYGGVGSVGVITAHASYARAYEQAGVDITVIRGGEEKARMNAMETLPEKTRLHVQRQVDTIRTGFIQMVSRNRRSAVSEKTVRETEGLDYMGEDARAIGFVTEVCSEHEAWGKLVRRVQK
jgi:ClpP class serine protease